MILIALRLWTTVVASPHCDPIHPTFPWCERQRVDVETSPIASVPVPDVLGEVRHVWSRPLDPERELGWPREMRVGQKKPE